MIRSRAAAVVLAALLAAGTSAVPSAASAQEQGRHAPVFDGVTAPELAGLLGRIGMEAQAGEDEFGPLVAARAGTLSFVALLFGCGADAPPRCGQVQFRAAFAVPDGRAAEIAAGWNLDRVFGRALADAEGRAAIEHAVHLAGGVTVQALLNNLALWENSVREFARRAGAAP